MPQLLFIDACPRGAESRTLRLAQSMLRLLGRGYGTGTLTLTGLSLRPIDAEGYLARQRGIQPPHAEEYAHAVADADLILIAAPFWDMSFPALLKVFFEQVSIAGITFRDTPDGTVGNCRAKKLIYVTTRGMDFPTGHPDEQATPYLRALAHLWGIGDVICVSASGMDTLPAEERRRRLAAAEEEGRTICEELLNEK